MLILTEMQRRKIPLWKTAAFAALLALLGGFLAFENAGTRTRLDQTLLLFSGDEAKINQALSSRLTLWKDAIAMIKAHPVNGVGFGAFRFVYPYYAMPGDPFIQAKPDEETGKVTGASYAHQIVLEVTTETGLIGLAGLVAFYFLLIRCWKQAGPERRSQSLPFALAALAWLFPFNTHSSFYSAQWSVLVWLLVAMLCATLVSPQKRPEHSAS
jgi:O-antigen ligase